MHSTAKMLIAAIPSQQQITVPVAKRNAYNLFAAAPLGWLKLNQNSLKAAAANCAGMHLIATY